MNDALIDRAAEFLVTLRPADHYRSKEQVLADYRAEICQHLQLVAALKMAGIITDPAATLLNCAGCSWAGPADQLLNQGRCPACGGVAFEGMPTDT